MLLTSAPVGYHSSISSKIVLNDPVFKNECDRFRSMNFWNQQLKTYIGNDLEIGELVDKGGMGHVYQIRDTKTGEVSRVLKVLCAAGDAESAQYFNPERGPHLFANINHPNVCSPTHFLYLTAEHNLSLTPDRGSQCIAMVMPYAKEVTTLLLKTKELAERGERIFHFGLLLANTLAELTRLGIQHGELHRRNVLVNEKFEPIIVDFDSAQQIKIVSALDYYLFQTHLIMLIEASPHIIPPAKQFLLAYLNKHKASDKYNGTPGIELPHLPERMIALMLACTDHLEVITQESNKPFDREILENSIQAHEKKLLQTTQMFVPRPAESSNFAHPRHFSNFSATSTVLKAAIACARTPTPKAAIATQSKPPCQSPRGPISSTPSNPLLLSAPSKLSPLVTATQILSPKKPSPRFAPSSPTSPRSPSFVSTPRILSPKEPSPRFAPSSSTSPRSPSLVSTPRILSPKEPSPRFAPSSPTSPRSPSLVSTPRILSPKETFPFSTPSLAPSYPIPSSAPSSPIIASSRMSPLVSATSILAQKATSASITSRSRWKDIKECLYVFKGCEGGWVIVKIIIWAISIFTFGVIPAFLWLGSKGMDYFCPREL